MLTIDGSQGEGGGQILRTSVALSMVTGTPLTIDRIRAGRKKPGLMRQHLTAVLAAAEVAQAGVEGAELGSSRLVFQPGTTRPGEYHFNVGTAGSTTLVLQTVLPALLTADGPSTIVLEGGTHNPFAPPFDFLAKAFLPIVNRMGPAVVATLERPGFYPGGGGRLRVTVNPSLRLARLDLLERGAIRRRRASAVVAKLPRHIAERELEVVRHRLGLDHTELRILEVSGARSPGNVVLIEVESEHVTEVFVGFGARGIKAEVVAGRAVDPVDRYVAADVPVGVYLADQLLLPLVLAGGGSFRTMPLSAHAETNIEVIKRFCDVDVTVRPAGPHAVQVSIR